MSVCLSSTGVTAVSPQSSLLPARRCSIRTPGKLETDLGLPLSGHQLIQPPVRRRRVPQHGPAQIRRRESFRFFLHSPGRAPIKRPVHERSMRRVHQPDHCVVHVAGEAHRPHHVVGGVAEARDLRHRRQIDFVDALFAHENPQVALPFANRIAAHLDPARVQVLAVDQRRYRRADAGAVEPPAVITALDLVSIVAPVRQRDAAVRTDVVQGEDSPLVVAADQHRLAQERSAEHPAAP